MGQFPIFLFSEAKSKPIRFFYDWAKKVMCILATAFEIRDEAKTACLGLQRSTFQF